MATPVKEMGPSITSGETCPAGLEGLENPSCIRRLHTPSVTTENCTTAGRRKEITTDYASEKKKKEKHGICYCFRNLTERLPTIGGADIEESSSEFEELLRFGAWQVVQLIVPVLICIVVVVVFQLTIEVYSMQPQTKVIYLPFDETSTSSGTNFLFGLVNALVFVTFVVIVTIIFVLLLKFKCDKAILVWMFIASGVLMFLVSTSYFFKIVTVRSLVIDWFMFVFVTWNFGSLGLIAIQWKGPLRVQQGYLILSSALVAIVMIAYFPNWTTWILLAGISVYDILSVLCPKGPLNILVEIVKERGDVKLPALIYSSTMMWMVGMADVSKKSPPSGTSRKGSTLKDGGSGGEDGDEDTKASETLVEQRTYKHEEQGRMEGEERQTKSLNGKGSVVQEEEKRGFKLGLGDFIFYSVLVGKAASISQGNWIIVIPCCVAILMGLCLTSLILGVVHKALPALPISIFFGLVFYFASQYVLAPYVEILNVNQVFI